MTTPNYPFFTLYYTQTMLFYPFYGKK